MRKKSNIMNLNKFDKPYRNLKTLNSIAEQIGNRKELIQASGGNLSFKNKNTLWIKASGTTLNQAKKESIFLPLNLKEVIQSIQSENEIKKEYNPLISTKLRASIETGFHAILPYKYVLHTHPIDVIAQTVLENAKESISTLLDGIDWSWIGYKKPGYELARSIFLKNQNNINPVYILENHGLIICGNDEKELLNLQEEVLKRLKLVPRTIPKPDLNLIIRISKSFKEIGLDNYLPREIVTHSLALDPWSKTLSMINPLYPDHLVFCGMKPVIVNKNDFQKFDRYKLSKSKYCIVQGAGVILFANASSSTEIMLETQSQIHLHIPPNNKIKTLTNKDCAALLNWEAEAYRITMAQ